MLRKTLLLGVALLLGGWAGTFAQPAPMEHPFLIEGSALGYAWDADLEIERYGRTLVAWSEWDPELGGAIKTQSVFLGGGSHGNELTVATAVEPLTMAGPGSA